MKKLTLRLSLIFLIGSIIFHSCKHSPDEVKPQEPGTTPPVDTIACDSTNVTYPGTVYPILNTYCISCHSGATPAAALDFNDYEDVAFIAQSGQFVGSINHDAGYSPMPQNQPKLSSCEIALIEKWINDTTFVTPPDTTACDTLSITYPGTIYPILQANCISCHGPPNYEAGLDFTDYGDVSFLAQSGALMGSILHDDAYEPMPKDAPPLSDCEILQIQMWINDTTFDPGNGGIPCDPDTVYFQNDVLPLLLSSCGISGCHDELTAEDDVILTSYYYVMQTADVQPFEPWESDIIEVINETDPDDRMPPPPAIGLIQDQKDMLYTWILQGALNNSCDQEDCDSTNVSFSETVFPIIQNSCYGCHSGPTPNGNISLANYNEIKSYASILPGNPGSLLGAIIHYSENEPMPQSAPPLTDCKIGQIRNWINEGMPDN